MHLCSGVDTDLDYFGKFIFKPAEAHDRIALVNGEACPMCRQMRVPGAVPREPAVPAGIQRVLRQLRDVPFHRLGIYPAEKADRRNGRHPDR